ncbi:MAG: Rdx family protein [Betaproteobacteria bacterium]|nr:Rdx family protein [Betaproteobacteria bacterium]
MERDFGARATLAKSSGGVFEVEADGRLVYSKRSSGRFPQAGEVARALRT